MAPTREQRTATLAASSAARSQRTAARAIAAIEELQSSGRRVSFPAVAQAAGVSLPFLYGHPSLRNTISELRQHPHPVRQAVGDEPSDSSIVRSLRAIVTATRAQLHDERVEQRAHSQALRQDLAAAHGEILRLRRLLGAAPAPTPEKER